MSWHPTYSVVWKIFCIFAVQWQGGSQTSPNKQNNLHYLQLLHKWTNLDNCVIRKTIFKILLRLNALFAFKMELQNLSSAANSHWDHFLKPWMRVFILCHNSKNDHRFLWTGTNRCGKIQDKNPEICHVNQNFWLLDLFCPLNNNWEGEAKSNRQKAKSNFYKLHNFKFSMIFSYPCEGVSFFRQLQSAIGDGEGGGQ